MRRWIFLTLAASVAVLPAVFGIAGNATLSQSVPALVPAGAVVLPTPTPDDHGGRRTTAETTATTTTATTAVRTRSDGVRHEDGVSSSTSDDRSSSTGTRRSSTATHGTGTDDHSRGVEPGDDSGGHGGSGSGSGSGGSGSGKGSGRG